MKVNSTGLGSTTLTAHISRLLPADEPGILIMKIESTQPVHWHITCRMEPKDVRDAIKMVLRPGAMGQILKMALGLSKRKTDSGAVTEAKQNG